MIQEINWDNFGAKFSSNKQSAFERLCYLLFCKEFNKNIGIFRFQNHAGIETNPIEKDEQVIGWQAKFYTTALSGHKDDFISSIDTTKTRHPNVNKIIFYINKDFGQDSKKTDPQYKVEIENHAKTKGVNVEWRTMSYFESPFVCEQNFSIAQHFFDLKKGILDSIQVLITYADSLLKPIHSEITFGDKRIKLDRLTVVTELQQALNISPIVILSGGAGVGKTAVIKDFFLTVKDKTPFYIFKATQFNNLLNIDVLFKSFGELAFSDFVDEHKDIDKKYVVVDSAEKLSDIENQEVFQAFLNTLIDNGWNIIFTVRHSYLDDLRFQFKEIYNVNFRSLNIPDLSAKELEKISTDHSFKLPQNERFCGLLQVPLYLNVYLQSYADIKDSTNYTDFRNIIWKKQIQCSTYQKSNLHIRREECFLKIAQERADSGNFFAKANGCDQEALQKLGSDEVIKFDSSAGGYFIVHDVYEEWAFDKIIERSFIGSQDYGKFYQNIGSSLPVRRAFRSWLSDKLFINDEDAKKLIGFTIGDDQVESHWKDEVLVSVLLSDYSDVFFTNFEKELLKKPERVVSSDLSSKVVRSISITYKYENTLLHKILFLLRIACKTIDENFLHLLGLTRADGIALKTVFTTPKGKGWDCTIAFLNKHKEELRFSHMSAILPVLYDWNNKNKEGETTKNASQIALFYYEELTKQKGFYFSDRDDTKDKLISTILNGSSEIKSGLIKIVTEVTTEKDTSHRGRYYELVQAILSSLPDSYEVAKNLPKEVIDLANLFWFYTPPQGTGWHSDYRNDIEQYFNLSEHHFDYYPASAFQTPIFALLQTVPQDAVNFILSFTNKSVEYFAKSEFAQYEAEEIEVFSDVSGKTIKQYICHRIWNIYRGTQVAPAILESIHMALERWLLMMAKSASPEVLESWCLYLIKNSRSASITAVVASVVLAEPSKLFNVAQILFRTKDFFFFDTARMQLDMTAKSTYSISHDPGGLFKNERIKTCEDKHRSSSLEYLALNYQLFRSETESEEEATKRQEVLWKIFDDYYARLPEKSKETENDKTWRLYLARMDRRKMRPTTEKQGDKILIQFNPEIDPELKKYSEDSLKKNEESAKYIQLQLWSSQKFEKNKEEYEKYQKYEGDVSLVIKETKEIIHGLRQKDVSDNFKLFNGSIPAYVCAILMRDYFEKLNISDKELCKKVLMGYITESAKLGPFSNSSFNGTQPAILSLPILLQHFPNDVKKIKRTFFLLLVTSYGDIASLVIRAVLQDLWKISFDDAHSIFLGYLLLKPKYEKIEERLREQRRKNHTYNFSASEVLNLFEKEHKNDIERVVSNKVVYSELSNFNDTNLDVLKTAFELLPLKTQHKDHKNFLSIIFPIFSKKLFPKIQDRDDRIDPSLKQRFLNKLAYFVLMSDRNDIQTYIKPFIDNFEDSRDVADLFSEFVSVEDRLGQYEEFWVVWELFYPKIVEVCCNLTHRHYLDEIVRNYLLAWRYWKESAKEWHTLKDREKQFFEKVAKDIGGYPVVLYSISKVLNDIGSGFRDDGIFWISDMLEKNAGLSSDELEINTVYYLENIVRGYILKNRYKIRTTSQIKNKILIILNFLLAKGSVTAYLLREDIL